MEMRGRKAKNLRGCNNHYDCLVAMRLIATFFASNLGRRMVNEEKDCIGVRIVNRVYGVNYGVDG